MVTLRIQHAVPSYEAWQRAFDADPLGRKAGGVRRYTVLRAVGDAPFVMIDLEFDTREAADAFREKLERLWKGAAQAVMREARAWVVEAVQSVEL